MRRAMLSAMVVAVLIAATGLASPQAAQAGPGSFNFSIGTGYYGGGYYPPYGGYAYPQPVVPQTYFYGSVPFGGPRCGFGAPPYASYYRGFPGRPGYGPYGHHHGHYRW